VYTRNALENILLVSYLVVGSILVYFLLFCNNTMVAEGGGWGFVVVTTHTTEAYILLCVLKNRHKKIIKVLTTQYVL
jgi:hypothetical protein